MCVVQVVEDEGVARWVATKPGSGNGGVGTGGESSMKLDWPSAALPSYVSLQRLPCVTPAATPCHSSGYPVSLQRLPRVTPAATPCHSSGYPVSLQRLPRVIPAATPCHSSGYPVSFQRLPHVIPVATPMSFQ